MANLYRKQGNEAVNIRRKLLANYRRLFDKNPQNTTDFSNVDNKPMGNTILERNRRRGSKYVEAFVSIVIDSFYMYSLEAAKQNGKLINQKSYQQLTTKNLKKELQKMRRRSMAQN